MLSANPKYQQLLIPLISIKIIYSIKTAIQYLLDSKEAIVLKAA